MAERQSTGSITSVLNWPAVGVGFVTAAALAIFLGALGSLLGLGGNPGAAASLEFVALFVGGYVAARRAGRPGVIQGMALAIVFILISASIKAWVEIDLAGRFGPGVLGPMDMGGLILGDLVHLIGACSGGWLGDSQRDRAERRADASTHRTLR